MSPETWREVLDVNLSGSFCAAKAVAPFMRERGHGGIINAMSTSAWGKFGQANYAASKAGLLGLTRTLAIEWATYGITVTAVAPGYIDTELTAGMPEADRRESIGRIPVGRIGRAFDVARTYLFLAAPESDFITGQVIVVDGGRSLS
jgi:3-oxoacyl-[acyl-carrier protein] reductase